MSKNSPQLKRLLSEGTPDFNAATDAAKRRKRWHEERGKAGRSEQNRSTARQSHAEYTVGWICALSIEFAAGRSMLDNIHDDLPRTAGDTNAYVLGSIGEHNVVMACLPEGQYGTNNAAIVASHMLRSFSSICVGLMVGIGGGVPEPLDIRLGDIVVGSKVIQYDMGKLLPGGRVQRTGIPKAPPPLLLNAVSKLRAAHETTGSQVPSILQDMHSRYPDMSEYAHPDCADRLFLATYDHDGVLDCSHCNPTALRQRHGRTDRNPRVFYGGIASGNQVVKSGTSRNSMAKELDIVCFEMEAAGLMDNFSCLAIRGICDYADSHKNKQWKKYAAATAAAYAKELLSVLTPSVVKNDIPATIRAIEVATLARRESILELLRFEQIDFRHDNIKNAYHKTCEWLLQDTIYQTWLDPFKLHEHHGFLWLSGKPGVGKSTIMKFAFSRARRDTEGDDIIIAFFFNARGNILEKSTAGLYRSLLFQLLDELPDLQGVLDDTALIPRRQKSCPSVDVLQELLRNAISGLDQRRLTCFIDALDECDEEQVREMIVYFEGLSEDAIGGKIHLSICFSSRHYPHIDIRNGLKLVLEDQPGHQRDLERYVKSHLRAGNGPYADRVRAQVLEKAGGVFMWVVLVVELLNKEFTRGRMLTVEKRIQQIPSKLSELFGDILRRDDDDMEDFLLCIQWILYAKRPLKRKELYFAMRSGLSDFHEDMLAYDPEKDTEEAMDLLVISASRGLAEITKSSAGIVQFIHESVIDFLVKEKGLQQLWPDLCPEFPSRSHERLKQCCLFHITPYISRKTLNAYSWKGKMIRESALEKYPFLEYAARQVLHHADAASEEVPQDSFLENFPLKDWIHLSNLPHVQQIRRYTPNVTLAYILAENNLVALLECHVQHHPNAHVRVLGERYRFPLFAALANGHLLAAKALFGPAAYSFTADELFQTTVFYDRDQSLFHWAIQGHNVILAKLMIGSNYFNYEALDKKGHTAVHLMALAGDDTAVLIRPLIERLFLSGESMSHTGLSPVATHSQNLELADSLGESISRLDIEKAKPLVDSKNLKGRSPLSLAAGEGHEAVVQTLLQFDVDLESADNEHRRTPLSFAADAGYASIIRLLLDRGSSIDTVDGYGNTPLYNAVANEHEPAVALLAERGASLHGQSNGKDWSTPLYKATEKGLQRTVQLLLESGACANNNGSTGWVPLVAAAAAGNNEIVSLLLHYGASVDGPLLSGASIATPLYKEPGAPGGHEVIAKLLRSHEPIVDDPLLGTSIDTPLYKSASERREVLENRLRTRGAYVDGQLLNTSTDTPLYRAALEGHEATVNLLLSHGASVGALHQDPGKALYTAAFTGNELMVKLLLERGLKEDSKGEKGYTALHAAASLDRVSILRLLLQHGASVNHTDNSGETPLFKAARHGKTAAVQILLENGADTNVLPKSGKMAIEVAVENGHKEVIQKLVAHGALSRLEAWENSRARDRPSHRLRSKRVREAVESLLGTYERNDPHEPVSPVLFQSGFGDPRQSVSPLSPLTLEEALED
ncbi:PFS domain-containing protein [Colletotrichum sojae]|uniref:PFS domain-containing protein n=1 Tax=Colletotrichum sojae TaxID=2175907 RepID=A0A8H6J5T7_9PEZI|nr:PFS domain-containing protein [Colletotrichum sojae]